MMDHHDGIGLGQRAEAMWSRALAIGAATLLIAASLAYAIVDGPRRYAASEEREATAERIETDTVCQRLGASPVACAVELDGVRQRSDWRGAPPALSETDDG